MNILLLIIAAIGLLLIIKYGFIFNVPREIIKNKAFAINRTLGEYISKLLSCSQCLGFWVGLSLFLLNSLLEQQYNNIIYYSILFGFIISFLGNTIDMFLTLLDEIIYHYQNNNESKTEKD